MNLHLLWLTHENDTVVDFQTTTMKWSTYNLNKTNENLIHVDVQMPNVVAEVETQTTRKIGFYHT